MPDDDVEQQKAIAVTFASAITAIEQRLIVKDGKISLAETDPPSDNLADDTVRQLLDSLGEANSQIANGELALADIGMDGVAHA
jgi:hypothetical protein